MSTRPGDGPHSPPKQQQHRIQPNSAEPKNCKKCRAVLGSGTTRFGHQPAYDVYVCAACGFIEWIAVP
jgi:DNA-directed RNA polymerase subunit M/transcription elongation factor TFIIS